MPRTSSSSSEHIMIIAGEASGDMHGANLVKALQAMRPDITFSGMGGKELAAAGVDILFDAAKIAVVGVVEVFSHLKDIFKARQTLIEEMRQKKPALLILIDFPDFNMLLAAQAKKLDIPVFYYISPQVWAWRSGRVKKIGRLSRRVATILPFEQQFYKNYGYEVDFVGHPLLDTVTTTMSRAEFLKKYDIPPGNRLIGIIPGSRSKEIKFLLADFLQAAVLYEQQTDQSCTFLLPQASTISDAQLEENGLGEFGHELDIRVIAENRYDLMAACDAALTASGTVTLELAILGTPAVVAYKLAPKTYLLGKILIRNIRFFSLVNLISDKQIIPELLQDEVTPTRLASELDKLLTDPLEHQQVHQGLQALKSLLGGPGASAKAASIALEIIRENR
ncbi:lipid-A-disaccharide synthase [Desulfogranum marinum]|uniref:lipid-A-disaccharide synthase n=1 Tax=Desulfogranum marinum TaxID=453220 RepID=UPI001962D11C|nr:lipid-A-disaccharide synthase [Desulfogranum marinum]MBM9511665.1 lipid-A-disaccharide synthase [Desulfogranum marinum]